MVTQFVYDREGHLLVEADSSGDPIREYIWLDDMPVAPVDSSGTSPAIYFIHTDHLGRPRKMTDEAWAVVWDGVFDPFDKVTSISGAATDLLMFPGQYHDSETQLSQNWHRDYDPSLGRYIESDPIGLEGGINTYAYAKGNPVRGAIQRSAKGCGAADRYPSSFLRSRCGAPGRTRTWTKWAPGKLGEPLKKSIADNSDKSCREASDEPERCRKAMERCNQMCINTYIEAPR